MGNLEQYLRDEPLLPPSPEQQLREAMEAHDIDAPDNLALDGILHRFNTGGKTDDAGWYVAYSDEIPAGSFGNWRTNETYTFRANIGRPLSMMEQRSTDKRILDAKNAREAEKKARALMAKDSVTTIWDTTSEATDDHPYLVAKGVKAHNLHITGDGRLIVPVYNFNNELVNLQYIDKNSKKRFHSGADIKGNFTILGDPTSSSIFVCEGYATASSVYEASGIPTVVAFNAGNLNPVIDHIRTANKSLSITIVADNDLPNEKTGHRAGQEAANSAADLYGCTVILPPIEGMDANDYVTAGGDLAALLSPTSQNWIECANSLLSEPKPISWLIKHWLQSNAMAMLFGPSGCGKTFVALDWLLSIATGRDQWMGNKVRHGDVVYLCGEGHHGLRGRIAAWAQTYGITDLSHMYVSQSATDLDKPNGLQLAIQSIHALSITPSVIAVDTLNRFLSGDENSAQDTKVFLDSCTALMAEFSCTILVVHHTGVSPEAQNRARGSSAWKGALDAEIAVENNKGTIILKQTKMKDAEMEEPIYMALDGVAIDGWYDEDNEQVTSAVVTGSVAPIEPPSAKDLKYQQCLQDAWKARGSVDSDGDCYLSKDSWKEFLIDSGMSKEGAKKALQENANRMVGKLLDDRIIEAKEGGFIVADSTIFSVLLLTRGGNK